LNLRKKIKKSLPIRKEIEVSPVLIRKLFDEARIIDHPEYNGVFKNREYIFNFIHLILFTGLRLRTACSLKWEHINLNDKPEDFKPAHMLVYGLKGDQDQSKKYRFIIPLTKYLKTILNNQYKLSGNKSQWVFPSNNGRDAIKGDDSKPMSSPRKNIERVARHIGHPFSLHELRYLFASVGASIGHPEEVIKRLLHHGISSITQRYIHNIVSKSIKVYEEIHEEMLRIWDVSFFDGK
jgi:Site-specific recombinase XerD